MVKPRVKETDHGIQGASTVETYDRMERGMRDRGWISAPEVIKSGIDHGRALEIGPGPGYLGLEWLKATQGTTLTGVDISADMVALAEKNAREYGLSERSEYVHTSAERIPFADGTFDAVFSNGSLHEWANPIKTFNEIGRVLKPGGRVFISDLRRDLPGYIKWVMWFSTQPRVIRPYLLSSIGAAYTVDELRELIRGTRLGGCTVSHTLVDLQLAGMV
jgi:ubiquinone/menaquinone biosynthesis C-methylase UbiE